MTDQLNGIGSRKAMFEAKPELAAKAKDDDHKTEKRLHSGEDRVTLDQSEKAQQTYGPIPGVEVGTPYQLLRSLVIKTLQDQGAELLIDTGSEILDLQQLTPEKAQELISADGYFGVEQTSNRIVDFAINAFGNDPAKLEEMRAAIEDGFQQAAQAFGGSLPEISHQTYDAIMEKLDAFAEQAET
ncbi:MAG TPA: hypothetical protein VIR78_12995 [Malonomonas sp.]